MKCLERPISLSIYLCGGGELAGALLPEIDRVILKRHPVIFGAGIPLFGDRTAYLPRFFKSVRERCFTSGVCLAEYAAVPSDRALSRL